MSIPKLSKISLFSLIAVSALFSGCGGGGNSSTLTLTIPEVKSIMENSNELIMKLTASQEGTYSFKITGPDKDYFTVDNDGNLKFLEAPDYEQKQSYHITVELYEGDTLKTSKNVTINVTDDTSDNNNSDINAPVFDSVTAISIEENKLEITNIQAHDNSGSVSFSITGGDDKDRFLLDRNSGKLTFNHFTADYENPSDKNADNIYEIEITAIDNASNKTTKNFTIEVTDVPDTGTDDNAKVLKTGLNDAPNNSAGFGDPRTVDQNGNIVSIGNNGLFWEDTSHVNTEVTFDGAAEYCSGLTLAGRNWRVPTRKELFEFLNYGGYPIMNDNITHKSNSDFWTKTTLLEGRTYNGQNFEVSEKGWYISFKFGDDDYKDKVEKLHVRCVSGGTTFSNSGSFVEHTDYIQDTLTGLQWENNDTAISQHITWNEAKTRCETLPGGTWRLPNINELHTLMPESGMDVLIYSKLKEELSIGPFWSSSTVPYNTEQAFYMENREYADPGCHDDDNETICRYGDTQNNAVENKDLNGSIRSICVRGGRL